MVSTFQENKIIDIITGSQGDVDMLLYCKDPELKDPAINHISSQDHIHMKGAEVFKFATRIVPYTVSSLMERNNIDKDDLNCIIPHQANKRIIDKSARDLKIDLDKFYLNIGRYGNTSAASVAIAIDEAVKTGFLKKGDKFITVAFGGGLTWGGAYIEF